MQEGWPIHTTVTHIEAGQEVRLTSDPNAKLSSNCLPVTFPFEEICQQGDAFFVGRWSLWICILCQVPVQMT